MLLEIIAIILALIIGLIIYARWHYGTLEKMGIKVIGKPWLIFGNTFNVFDKPGGYMDIEYMKKFGPVYGIYEGREPQIHVCDAELIRLITTKDADYFDTKRILEFGDKLLNQMPDFQKYDKWKALRTMITPIFSSAKLKLMGESMNGTCQSFCDNLEATIKSTPGHKLEKYDLRDAYFTLVTDMIAQSCFSVKVDNPHDPNNMFADIVRQVYSSGIDTPKWLQLLSYSFPFLAKFTPCIFNPGKVQEFNQILLNIMEQRKQSGEKKPDVVEMCLEEFEKVDSPEYKAWEISKETILIQGFVFFFAGQDQLSTISSCLVYYMLKNPKIEEKLYSEIDAFLKKYNGSIEYGNLSELVYLNACITESARLVPFFSRTERVCTKNWESAKHNLKIKEGTVIMIPIWAANQNPKYWGQNPEQFDPERFMPGNKEKLHPYAMTSFGFGPRNCPGRKFSMDSMMLMNCYIFKFFKFHLRQDSKPEFYAFGPLFTPHREFYFDVSIRKDE